MYIAVVIVAGELPRFNGAGRDPPPEWNNLYPGTLLLEEGSQGCSFHEELGLSVSRSFE
jgi:hypothetical protein